jgi:hypothetical protein
LTSGAGDRVITQIGHGAYIDGNTYTSTGNITITAKNINLSAGNDEGFAQIGHGGSRVNGNLSGNIDVTATNRLSMASANGTSEYALIGHGALWSFSQTGNREGNILVNVSDKLKYLNSDSWIGHVTPSGTISNANVRITSGALDFALAAMGNSFDLNSTVFRDNMIANLAGGDVTIGSKSAPITISNPWTATSASNRNLNFLGSGEL